ncbi:MAG: hypothetical protein ACTSXH_07230 [Promethearchaeota archaeon]
MPEVLELKPLKEKVLKLILIESEFPIDWWFEVPEELKEDLVWNLHLISREYLDLIENLIEKYKPDFALEERPNYLNRNEKDPLKVLFQVKNIPFKHADIDENAEDYLSAALEEHRQILEKLEERIAEIIKKNGKAPTEDEEFQRLLIWKEYLKKDYEDQEDEVRYKVREAWMMMNILNLAKDVGKKVESKKLKGFFICDKRHFDGLDALAESLGVETEKIKIKKSIKTEEIEKVMEKEIEVKIRDKE